MIYFLKKTFQRCVMALVCMLFLLAGSKSDVQAAEGYVTFDQSSYLLSYDPESGDDLLVIKVNIDCDSQLRTYHVELGYDTNRLRYIIGAEAEVNGVITLEGTAVSSEVQYELYFHVINGGNAGIYAKHCTMRAVGDKYVDITSMAQAAIVIDGPDASGAESYNFSENGEIPDTYAGIPVTGRVVTASNDDFYVVDLTKYIPAEGVWVYIPTAGLGQYEDEIFLTGLDWSMRYLYLLDMSGGMHMMAIGPDGIMYPCVELDSYFYVSAKANYLLPEGMTMEEVEDRGIVYLQYKDGNGEFVVPDAEGNFVAWQSGQYVAAETNISEERESTALQEELDGVSFAETRDSSVAAQETAKKNSETTAAEKDTAEPKETEEKTADEGGIVFSAGEVKFIMIVLLVIILLLVLAILGKRERRTSLYKSLITHEDIMRDTSKGIGEDISRFISEENYEEPLAKNTLAKKEDMSDNEE